MKIRFPKKDGSRELMELTERAITVGRSPDADVVVLDERASRMHCGIRLWDGDYYVKDLQSKNGTFLNDDRVEMAKISPGDKVRVGTTVIQVESDDAKEGSGVPGPDTVMGMVQEEMSHGKGYDTILREIVDDSEGEKAEPVAPPKAKVSLNTSKTKKPVQIKLNRPRT